MIRRVCLFGGAGCGKSTTAAYVFWNLKKLHLDVELVSEYVKDWAYEKRTIESTDQQYIYTKQQRKEDRLLRAGVKLIVTDSPLFLNCVYAKQFKADGWQELIALAKKFEKRNKALNIFIDRGTIPYQAAGRYQTYDEAKEYDRHILNFIELYKIKHKSVTGDEVLNCVLAQLRREGVIDR